MRVHPASVVAEDGLRHEGDRLSVVIRDVLHDVLVEQHLVGGAHQRIELQVDFGLTTRRDFVMMALDLDAASLHGQHHLGAQVLIVIGRCDRKVALAIARAVAEIVLFPARVPAALLGVDVVKAVVFALIEAHVVEDEELGLGAKIRGVGDAGRSEIRLGLARNVAGIAVVALLGDRIDDVADQHQCRHFGEGIEQVRAGSGLSSMSLSWMAAQARIDEPSMPKPSSNEASVSWSIG